MADNVTSLRQPSENGNTVKRPTARITEDMVMRSAVMRRQPSLDSVGPRNPFQFPSFPPLVENAVKDYASRNPDSNVRLLAQDDTIAGTYGWAAADPMVVQFSEGVAFPGYSYLSTLAQRAEFRVVSETIAAEMTREWIDVKIASGDDTKSDRKKFIEDKLDNLDAQQCFRKIAEGDGFFGRAHLYLDTGVTEDPDELITDIGDGRSVLSKLKVGPNKNQKLLRLHPIEATWCYPTYYESVDPLRRDFYNPITWFVLSREIHRSRLLTFVGRPVPDILKPSYAFGGLAMSQMLKPAVDNWLRTRQAVSDLVQTFSYNVLRTNLDASTGQGGEQLWGRIALFNNIKNNQGTLVIDKDAEDWSNVSVPVGSLDRLQAQSQEHMAAISRIPLVKLLGIQPAGLNASSEGELISFEDWIHSFQNILFRPALRTIIDFIQLTEWGEIDDDITFEFNPIRQLKPIEEAQLQSVVGQTREGYLQSGAVTADEVREVLANDKQSPFTGLDLTQPLPEPSGMPGTSGSAPGMPGMPPMPSMGPGEHQGGGPEQAGGVSPQRGPQMPKPPKPPQAPMPSIRSEEDAALYDTGLEVVPLHYEDVSDAAAPLIRRPRY